MDWATTKPEDTWPPYEFQTIPPPWHEIKDARVDSWIPAQQLRSWRAHEWHHVAVRWDDRATIGKSGKESIEIWLDGKEAGPISRQLPQGGGPYQAVVNTPQAPVAPPAPPATTLSGLNTQPEPPFCRLNEDPAGVDPSIGKWPRDHIQVGGISRRQATQGGLYKFNQKPDLPANGTVDDMRFYEGNSRPNGSLPTLPDRYEEKGVWTNEFDLSSRFFPGQRLPRPREHPVHGLPADLLRRRARAGRRGHRPRLVQDRPPGPVRGHRDREPADHRRVVARLLGQLGRRGLQAPRRERAAGRREPHRPARLHGRDAARASAGHDARQRRLRLLVAGARRHHARLLPPHSARPPQGAHVGREGGLKVKRLSALLAAGALVLVAHPAFAQGKQQCRVKALEPPEGRGGTNVSVTGLNFSDKVEDYEVLAGSDKCLVLEAGLEKFRFFIPTNPPKGELKITIKIKDHGECTTTFKVIESKNTKEEAERREKERQKYEGGAVYVDPYKLTDQLLGIKKFEITGGASPTAVLEGERHAARGHVHHRELRDRERAGRAADRDPQDHDPRQHLEDDVRRAARRELERPHAPRGQVRRARPVRDGQAERPRPQARRRGRTSSPSRIARSASSFGRRRCATSARPTT